VRANAAEIFQAFATAQSSSVGAAKIDEVGKVGPEPRDSQRVKGFTAVSL
jgi:hypothetical protein